MGGDKIPSDPKDNFIWEGKKWTGYEIMEKRGKEDIEKTTGEEEVGEVFDGKVFSNLEEEFIWEGEGIIES